MISGRFALRSKKEIEDKLIWCLKEIKKDIEASDPRDPGTSKVEKQSIDGVEGMHIENCLAALILREACCSAAFCASRRSFKLKRKDNFQKNFTVLGLSKKRKVFEAYRGIEDSLPDKDFQDLEKGFKETVAQAKDWLDGCPMSCLDS